MPTHQYVHCPDLECDFHRKPILLPDSSPQQIDLDLKGWPIDGTQLYVACPGCRLVSVHYTANILDFSPTAQYEFRRGKVWWRITTRCAMENCTTLSKFHVLMEKAAESNMWNAINDKFQIGFWRGATACGHPFGVPHDFYFDPVEGRMIGGFGR